MNKRIWIYLICSLVLIMSACSNDDETSDEEVKEEEKEEASGELGDYEVDLAGHVLEEDEKFIVQGESNLLEGSIITGEVIVDDGETIISEKEVPVAEDGSFEIELDHHIYGDADIEVRFDFDDFKSQEEEIFEHYGEEGEKLTGPFVYERRKDDWKEAKAVVPYDAKGKNDMTIQAPDWEERPDDYGDGRVWIEDVEIDDDGMYFYVTGRTNLIEGTYIRITYGGLNGSTRILKDGTFASKFEYRYEEGYDMKFEVDPANASDQWNFVREHYGDDGSEFVGDLVERSDLGSGNQKIVYIIEELEEE